MTNKSEETFTVNEIIKKLHDINYCEDCEFDHCTTYGEGCPLDNIINKIEKEFENGTTKKGIEK